MNSALIVPQEVASDLTLGCEREWLETNGLGSFAMGTVAGPATRRYHALLCAALKPPTDRTVLINTLEEEIFVDGLRHFLSAHFYPGTVHPEGHRHLTQFRLDPWPIFSYRVGEVVLEKSIFMANSRQLTVVRYHLIEGERARLFLRPLISGRDYHGLQQENLGLRPDAAVSEGLVRLQPYTGVPPLYLHHNGVYQHQPDWYRNFFYPVEKERGLPCNEDLFSPGQLGFDLTESTDALFICGLESSVPDVPSLAELEIARRQALCTHIKDPLIKRLTLDADQFVVARPPGATLVAGYPWFTDWGRDTFISLPGVALARRSWQLGRELLLAFAPHVKEGLVPNRFVDHNEPPEYNSVDAALWYVLSACRYVRKSGDQATFERDLSPTIRQIIDHFLKGTKYGIAVDDDGLIQAAAQGLQLTWMDAKVGDFVVTPRAGKPVEIQALWVAALEASARLITDLDPLYADELWDRAAWARSSFASSFWNESESCLYDVIDGRHKDGTVRPNQLYALGLCMPLIDRGRSERVLLTVEERLLTPVGLRTRALGAGYRGRITGGQFERDSAYHEGTVWPYLLGIYADACMRIRGRLPPGLLDGISAHVFGPGNGLLAEIFDGDSPHTPRGCPAQCWSVAEALRILHGEVGVDA